MGTCKTKTLNNKEYRCFFELTLQIIGGKWKPIILFEIAKKGVLRFGELRRRIPDITERMLTRQLREMEADELINREVYKEVPPKVEYTLKDMGIKLIPVLLSLRDWGVEYEKSFGISEKYTDEFFENLKPPLISEMYK